MNAPHEEASRWFAALRRGVMSLEERSQFDAWKQGARNATALVEMERTWAMLGALSTSSASILQTAQHRQHSRKAMLFAACVASLSICILSYGADSPFWTTLDWATR
ncbi:MAG: hypothetical protein RJB62_304 [Pseudomonadota bacterium]|jgi:ferric-dicitrate binding protein FerR (iron transport regulator)